MVFDWSALGAERKWPEAVEVDLLTEASGHRVHEEASGGTLDVDVVSEPVPANIGIRLLLAAVSEAKN